MTERPILFSAPMVRAILAGRKTQTRRMVKPQPVLGDGGCWFPGPPRQPTSRARHYANEAHLMRGLPIDFCPYGAPGDRLWVRETTKRAHGYAQGDYVPSLYVADGEFTKADAWPWKRPVLPSIHCPRGLSRITLEVTGVRVERLQAISEADARAEGIQTEGGGWRDYLRPSNGLLTPQASFATLWAAINGAGSWGSNPWVWAVEFKRVEP